MPILVQSNKKPRLTFPTLTGNIVTFNSQYALPLKSHTVDIDSVSGVSAINIGHVQKNFIKEQISVNNRYILANGTTAYNGTWGIVNVPIVGGQVYTISGINYPDTGTYFAWYDRSNTLISVLGNHKNHTNITAPANACYLGMSFLMSPSNTRYDLDTAQVELGASDTSYEAYNGTYTTINIGQTINEGEYDARTGILEATLPTVQTIQLPPCPIDAFEGVNNIWADTGDTTLQYPKFG